MTLGVNLFDFPHAPCNGDFFAGGRRLNQRAKLLAVSTNGIFFVFLKDRVELEAGGDPLSGESDDETAAFSALNLIRVQKVQQERAVVLR